VSTLTGVIVLGTVLHLATLAVMIWIRVRRTEGDGIQVASAKVTPCAVCGEPSAGWGYDGLDPNEQRDPHTGQLWSPDVAHYRPVCAVHADHNPAEAGLGVSGA
jgi:hypothetical protein